MRPSRRSRTVAFVLVSAAITIGVRPAGASENDAVTMVVSMLGDADPEIRAIGLDRVRHGVKGAAATTRFTELLGGQPASRQAAVIAALADRGDATALPAIRNFLGSASDAEVRVAAIRALGSLGSADELPVLLRHLAAADPERTAARQAIVALRGSEASRRLTESIRSAEPAATPLLIELLVERRDRAAVPDLVRLAVAPDSAVRQAAMRALGKLGGPDEIAGMVAGLLSAAAGDERTEAEKAIVAVCTRPPQRERAAAAFVARFEAAAEAERETLLPTLGRVGGPEALAIVDRLVADADPAKRRFGLKALTRWPDATVSDRILALLGTAKDADERDQLLGALIRIAPLPDNKLNDQQKLDLLKKTMGLCQRNEDRARVLERANAIRTIETFRFVLPYLDDAVLVEPACTSVVELAHHRALRDSSKEEFMKALDRVIARTKNAELVERANLYKEGKTWERKKG